jgi:hypothetical protein
MDFLAGRKQFLAVEFLMLAYCVALVKQHWKCPII